MDRPDDAREKQREQEIADIIREEVARPRAIDVDDLRAARRTKRDYLWMMRTADEATFRKYLTDLGWAPGSPEFEQHVRAWRASAIVRLAAASRAIRSPGDIFARCSIVFLVMYSASSSIVRGAARRRLVLFIASKMYHVDERHMPTEQLGDVSEA